MNDESYIHLGERDGWGGTAAFGLSAADWRRHVYIIGKTGTGKTTLLGNMMLQLIAQGHGVGFIDPHGDESERLLDRIPPSRTGHVLYFNPSDIEFPVALNLLARVPHDERHLTASWIVNACKSLWRDSWGPRMEYILYNALVALLDCENVSLLGVNRMLTDPGYRAWVLRQVKDPFIRAYWDQEYAGYDERFRREAIAPIQNKLGQFLLNPVIRNILGQVKCRVSFPFIIDDRRIFIANLSKGMIGHDKANLLGSLLVSQFQAAAMRRAILPEAERRDFFLFVDEFFNFTTDAFAPLLSEARKYRLSLTLAHQYVDQLAPEIRQAVLGNVGSIIVFRVGYSDAEVLENELDRAFSASILAALARYEAIVRLPENGTEPAPFQARLFPPIQDEYGRKEIIISKSRERFATPRTVVEAKLQRHVARKYR